MMAGAYNLPSLPVKHDDFLRYINSHPQDAVVDLVRPYNEYDSVVRKIYAQQPSHPAITDNLLNVVPLFDACGSADLRIRARDLESEPEEVKARFLMPLNDEVRKPNGAPAVVSTFKEFQTNLNLFSEGSLSDLDWSNVVAAGSAVTSSLLPVPAEYRDSKRGLRQFYHEKFAPASDVDLFLYGLAEEQAIEKIQQIETKIKDSILSETTTIRTKNTITIVSQYPTRHVQIVLRMYKSIAEILTGFDVDCSCAAYDGHQVYIAPRAVGAFITQINNIDLTRRSPSYENRLSKYSHRGFEVFWPQLDRSRIDPTIFERSFTRTVGLARLLVLEKLPKSSDRDAYLDRRRRERGQPSVNRFRFTKKLHGNIKNDWDDEVAEWVEEDEVSDYHTFTIPYGEKFHAKKIEKLIYTKDLLLNAEWNKPKDREVDLHRHPAFFGNVEDVIHDCCGSCPIHVSPEEKEIAEEESKIYVSGKITFLKDNPGRQEIGSFNPITETDWTEMAYVGNTAGLCQAIVDEDIESVTEWLSQGLDVNRRDYTGRTPLHLATMTSTPTIVQYLVDHGARLIARLADGRTALHLAAARGNVEIIKILLTKSGENEEEESRKEIARKEAMVVEEKKDQKSHEDDDPELLDDSEESDADDRSYATGSFVKVKKDGNDDNKDDNILDDTNDLDPDVYDINVLAWDNHSSPLHLAILNGHTTAVEVLVSSFGADVLLPIKLINEYNNSPRAAILTLVLALQLPIDQAKLMTSKLLQLGASPGQADVAKKTALHYVAAASIHHELLDVYLQHDQPAVQRTINYLSLSGYLFYPSLESALITAIQARNVIGAIKLLEAGANPTIQLEEFIKSAKDAGQLMPHYSSDQTENSFQENVAQPVILAVQKEQPSIALTLLARGADPNTLSPVGHKVKNDTNLWRGTTGQSLLDCVQERLKSLREYQDKKSDSQRPRSLDPDDNVYLGEIQDGTYRMWTAKASLAAERKRNKEQHALYEDQLKREIDRKGLKEKEAAIQDLVRDFEELEEMLLAKQAKTFKEMYPEIELPPAEKNKYVNTYTNKPEGPFKIAFDFKRSDLTDVLKEGYVQLFEAAWCGDLDTIKSLTLGMWGLEKQQSPLEIGVTDHRSFSPFSIAVMRGHLNTAKAILAIALAQYRPQDESGQVRYTIRTSGEGDEYNSENGDSDEDDIQVESYVIDDQFTIENVGEIKTQVESRILPLILLNGHCPIKEFLGEQAEVEDKRFHQGPVNLLQYAIWKDDADLLVFLLNLGQELIAKLPNNSDNPVYTTSSNEFDMALGLGRLRCLAELIKRTGAGLPLDELADQSGIEVKENPKFYQGLSIHGQKRADWAAAARGAPVTHPKETHPPLLLAARQGNLDAVEWFLGTAPGRHYTEFTQAHKQDKRLMRLALAEGGIERAITDWLGSRRHLVLHCAIISHTTDESERLVKYLVHNLPQCLEVKSVGGYTPLSLAFALHHFRFAKILIEAGADQTVRDKKGNNLLHLLLRSAFNPSKDRLDNLQNMLGLIDPLLVPSMLTERSSGDPGSLTPIAQWMVGAFSTGQSYRFHGSSQTVDWEDKLKLLRIVLDFSERTGQKHLELLDGAGNTVVHDAVRCQLPQVLQILLERRPDLLYRENTSGFTPAELAEASWVAFATANPPILTPLPSHLYYSHHRNQDDIIHKQPEHFVQDNTEEGSAQRKVYDMCRAETPDRVSRKRRLVTLFEANEVTKRLAAKETMGVRRVLHRSTRSTRRRRIRGEWSTESDEEVTDEVCAWAGHALPAT